MLGCIAKKEKRERGSIMFYASRVDVASLTLLTAENSLRGTLSRIFLYHSISASRFANSKLSNSNSAMPNEQREGKEES